MIALAPTPRSAAERRAGWIWPMFIVGLLSINATVVGVTVYCAMGDKSAAVEPDYYAKAVNFNQTLAQRETNTRLGWTADASLAPAADGGPARLCINLADASGAGLHDAVIDAELFSNLRASQRQQLKLSPTGEGRYAAPARIDRSGLWQVRVRVQRGDQTFTHDTQLLVP